MWIWKLKNTMTLQTNSVSVFHISDKCFKHFFMKWGLQLEKYGKLETFLFDQVKKLQL